MELYFLIFIGAVLLLILVELFIILRKGRRFSRADVEHITKEWHALEQKVKHEPGHAVIQADKVLDFVLMKKGYKGTLGEKLRKAEDEFTDIDSVWRAHKLRNSVAHEVGFVVTPPAATKAIYSIKKALWDLGIKV